MVKRILIFGMLFLFVFQGISFAAETSGEIVFKDALYGAAIGAVIAGAVYLIDQDDPGTKFGIGVAVGTIGGLFYGLTETRSVVEIKRGSIKTNIPSITIQKRDGKPLYSASLLKISF